MARTKTGLCSILLLVLVALSAQVTAQKDKAKERVHSANLPEAIWRDPDKIASLNLFYGAGGKRRAPDPKGTFTFVKEDMEATSPKFDVEDGQGNPVEGEARRGTRVGNGGDALSVGRRLFR